MSARLSLPLHLKARPSAEGVFEGYASTFLGPPDSFGDVIAPNAFAESLKSHTERSTMPALLWAHDQREPVGVWEELRETSKGLLGRGRLTLKTVKGSEAYELMKDQALGLSIGYRTEDSEPLEGGGRLLKSLDLVEVSLVAIPANHAARITSVKSALLESPASFEDVLRSELGLSAVEAKRIAAGGWNALARNPAPEFDPAAVERIARKAAALSNFLKR